MKVWWRAGVLLGAGVLSLSSCTDTTYPGGIVVPVLIAHRGASAVAPENTIAAFDEAVAAGADYLEFDVRMTRDGVLVVIHDESLDRTASGSTEYCRGRVGERSWSEIATCDAGAWFNTAYPAAASARFTGIHVPRLSDVLSRYAGKVGFYLEIKDASAYPGIVEKVLSELEAARLAAALGDGSPALYIQSFDAAVLQTIKQRSPSSKLVYLQGAPVTEGYASLFAKVREFAVGIAPISGLVTEDYLKEAHRACLQVHAWVVNSPEEFARLTGQGVDGILTDDPRRLLTAKAAFAATGLPASCNRH